MIKEIENIFIDGKTLLIKTKDSDFAFVLPTSDNKKLIITLIHYNIKSIFLPTKFVIYIHKK